MPKREDEEPAELRELARRTRILASALQDAERARLNAYADELDERADKLERQGKKR